MDKPKVNLTTLSHEVMNYCSSLKFLKERNGVKLSQANCKGGSCLPAKHNLLNLGKGHTAKTALTHMQAEPDLFLGATGLMSDIVLEHSVGPWVYGECLVTTYFMTEWGCQDLPSLQTQQESMLAAKDQICMRYF
ncbi:hypothetical protein BD769DRAFT_1386125 [Suillus cothurnatus]|nr:hypothetical protein BD769DRAFT_1386125 [Suillus cothurnatus]